MNISDSELAAFSSTFGLTGQDGTSATLQTLILNQLWTTVVLQRTGDSALDPYRTITSFSTRAKALTFAQSQKFTDVNDAVAIYQGSTLDTLVSGSQFLIDMYCARAGTSHPAPTSTEASSVATEVVKAKPTALAKKAAPSRGKG